MALKQAKVIAVTSVKGGTGKTTMTLGLAGILASKNLKTIIVDMDLHSGAIAPSLNLHFKKDIYTLVSDYMNHSLKDLKEYTVKYNDYLDVLAAPKDPRSVGKISAYYIDLILKKLKYKYDVVLIDTNHIIDDINLITFDNSDNIIYTITSDLIDLKNMKTMISIYKDMNLTNYYIVLNEALSHASYDLFTINSFLERQIDYIFPSSGFVKNMPKLLMDGKIFTLEKNSQKDKGTQVLIKILDKILE